MKISLKHTGSYAGLLGVQFPVVVDAEDVHGDGSLFRVPFEVMRTVPGWVYCDGDTEYGSHYAFFGREVDLYDNLPMKPIWINHDANGEITFSDTPEFRQEPKLSTEAVSGANTRKEKLLMLVLAYGVAISDACYESECGSMDNMRESLKEEKLLLEEIKQMIQDGV